MGIIDLISEGLSSAAQALIDALLFVLKAIAAQAEKLLALLLGDEILQTFENISNSLQNAWETVVIPLRAANQFLPLQEAFVIIVVMWGIRATIVLIRWILKFIPTLSS